MKPVKVGLLGLGTVGTGVVRIVEGHHEDLQSQVGSRIVISRIAVKDRHKQRSIEVNPDIVTDDPWSIVGDPEIDIVVEVMGGVEHTKELVMAALEAGKHVVTANKDLMALHGYELQAKARERGCDIFYEASVAGGIPIIRTLIEGFSSDRITKIMGIVNGTTNYILSKMSEEGAAYDDVLREAQALGYAESDPTADVEGLDAARKMTILATLGFRANIALEDVDVRGISQVTQEDIRYARQLGYAVKLLGIAESEDDCISVSVQPTMVRIGHPIAAVNGVFNAVYVYGEAVGETMFYGPGAGELPTATSIVADLVAVIKNAKLGVNGRSASISYKTKKLKRDDQIRSKYFMLLHVEDRIGVLMQMAQVFADCEVSIESVMQPPTPGKPGAELLIITHEASKEAMSRVLAAFSNHDAVRAVRSVYRVEG